MAFSSWLARLRSSSKPTCRILRNSVFNNPGKTTSIVTEVLSFDQRQGPRILSWATSLLPVALAVSAGSFAHQSHYNTSLCDAPNLDHVGVRIGGKDSTDYVVKGSHKKIPEELIDELKAICQDNMTMDYEERYFHGKPQNSFHQAINVPDVVVFPRSEDEVSKIVKSCNKNKVPIVPYGGATSIEGHTLSPHGGVCIDMTLMKV